MTDGGDAGSELGAVWPAGEGDGGVLRLLAAGMSIAAIADRLSSEGERKPAGSPRDVKAILAHAAMITREKKLLAPAKGAFLDKHDVEPSELDALRACSERLLEGYLTEPSASTAEPDPKRKQAQYLALRYADALVRQEQVLDALNRVDSSNAPLQAGLTGTDRRHIDEFLLYRNVKGRVETLDSLVGRWKHSVDWVEARGDSFIHDEFVDRLVSRDSLEDALSLLSPRARHALEPHIRPLDERFFDATRGVSTSIRPDSRWRPERWWWFRVPRRLGDHFQDRLKRIAPDLAREELGRQEVT